jgi:hypothetical protein
VVEVDAAPVGALVAVTVATVGAATSAGVAAAAEDGAVEPPPPHPARVAAMTNTLTKRA